MSLKDMFKKKSDYIKIISNDIKRQMKQQMLTKDVVYFIKDNVIYKLKLIVIMMMILD